MLADPMYFGSFANAKSVSFLTDGVVPVPARFQNVMELFALLAAVHNASRVWCAATHNCNHSLGVDIGHLEIKGFLEPETQGVDDGEEAQHGWLFD